MPEPLKAAAERIAWLGPIVRPDQLPRFEIAHYGGGRAALLNASWGGEMLITPENFPNAQVTASIVHIAALRTAERQLNFAKPLRRRSSECGMRNKFRIPNSEFRISAGTYGKICASEPDTVRELIGLCDFFFKPQCLWTSMSGQEQVVIGPSLDQVDYSSVLPTSLPNQALITFPLKIAEMIRISKRAAN